ncbi:hypothetical protein [uncultured Pseudoxanthomonas sp.]|uniref:hypothetical protein n=1 Tax=uncultured Pseudoxanthomonas sp. TaxID=281701 RepID=UPI0026289A00|nr:hypothetical protein [uncultured Pseudoxanthomonas sp.]
MRAGRETVQAGFGERFARNSALGMSGLALFAAIAVVVQGGVFPFLSTTACLAMSYFFRRRARQEEADRRRAIEDERDDVLLARGDRTFRIAASMWMVGLAIALAWPPVREALLAPALRVPGLLLVGVTVANVAGHATVAALYRRDRA